LDIRTFGNTNVTCYFMRHLSILILILILTGCVSRTDQKKIVICYNYKGFFTDTLTLKVDQRKFAMIIDSLDKPLDTNEGLLLSKDFQNIF
jgi:PBP1b-binding outer membrane lipoprotein LpoB